MKIKSIALAGSVAALTLIPAGSAAAYDNCAEAREHGVYNLSKSDPRAAGINDPDRDGIVCENGSKPNTPVQGGSEKTEGDTNPMPKPSGKETDDKALAETGGDSKTPFIAGAGALLLIGGGALAFRRKRQN